MHPGDAHAVAGDTDEAGEALVARPQQGLSGTVGAMSRLPLVVLHQVVELDEVDVVDAQPFEGALEAGPGGVTVRSPVLVATKNGRGAAQPRGQARARSRRRWRPCRGG